MMLKNETQNYDSGKSLYAQDEFSIYVFPRFEAANLSDKQGICDDPSLHWTKARGTRSKLFAVLKAQKLYETHQYEKVIVKHKFFDEKMGEMRGVVLKTYQDNQKPFFSHHPKITAVFAVVGGLALLLVVMSVFERYLFF